MGLQAVGDFTLIRHAPSRSMQRLSGFRWSPGADDFVSDYSYASRDDIPLILW